MKIRFCVLFIFSRFLAHYHPPTIYHHQQKDRPVKKGRKKASYVQVKKKISLSLLSSGGHRNRGIYQFYRKKYALYTKMNILNYYYFGWDKFKIFCFRVSVWKSGAAVQWSTHWRRESFNQTSMHHTPHPLKNHQFHFGSLIKASSVVILVFTNRRKETKKKSKGRPRRRKDDANGEKYIKNMVSRLRSWHS